ncbi:hypothetical protein ACJX0J_009436, partial [Zea mays]
LGGHNMVNIGVKGATIYRDWFRKCVNYSNSELVWYADAGTCMHACTVRTLEEYVNISLVLALFLIVNYSFKTMYLEDFEALNSSSNSNNNNNNDDDDDDDEEEEEEEEEMFRSTFIFSYRHALVYISANLKEYQFHFQFPFGVTTTLNCHIYLALAFVHSVTIHSNIEWLIAC